MCKKMLVIPVNRVVDPKRIIGKMESQGGGEAQGVAGYIHRLQKCLTLKLELLGRFLVNRVTRLGIFVAF
jgi:hypothetical protein